jgi:hypothetical protein
MRNKEKEWRRLKQKENVETEREEEGEEKVKGGEDEDLGDEEWDSEGSDDNDYEGLGLNGDEDGSWDNIRLQPRYPIQGGK